MVSKGPNLSVKRPLLKSAKPALEKEPKEGLPTVRKTVTSISLAPSVGTFLVALVGASFGGDVAQGCDAPLEVGMVGVLVVGMPPLPVFIIKVEIDGARETLAITTVSSRPSRSIVTVWLEVRSTLKGPMDFGRSFLKASSISTIGLSEGPLSR